MDTPYRILWDLRRYMITKKPWSQGISITYSRRSETERGNTPRTRNARLAAILCFMRFASIRDPASLPVAQRVLAIGSKRFDRPVLGYLTREQVAAILAAPDRGTWGGHRDAVLLATTYNTGARVFEITDLRVRDVLLNRKTAVHLH